jgi:hypothetical protein
MFNIDNDSLQYYSPYPSLAHPTKRDYLDKVYGDFDVPRSYIQRWRDIDRIGAGAITNRKPYYEVTRYREGEVLHEHVWCTMCHSEGHHGDDCPTMGNYLVMGAPNPFLTGPQTWWCEICR